MRVTDATMRVAHTLEVVRQAKVVAVVRLGDVDPDRRCLVYRSPKPKPQTYLHLWGKVGVVFLCLISPAALSLGRGGGACRRLGCC